MLPAVDYDFPVPARNYSRKGRPRRYPFEDMRLGGSFLVPPEQAEKLHYAAVKWAARHPGWGYITKKLPEGRRIWRTA